MAQYFIFTDDATFFELDSTATFSKNMAGRTTDFPLEEGSIVSDHYVNQNDRISMQGTITSIKSALVEDQIDGAGKKRFKSPDEYITGLEDLKRSKNTFTLFFGDNRPPLENCLFESLTLEQNKSRGTTLLSQSYKISFTAKQVRFVERAVRSRVTKEELSDLAVDKAQGSGITTDIVDNKLTLTQSGIKDVVTGAGQITSAATGGS